MCGILGVFAREGTRIDPSQLERMRDTMSHRGPDDAGLWCSEDRTVGLGHRRLAIIDLSPAGHAPMANEDGSVWVTFNGEIYNHQELRAELEQRGHSFRSHCDTEVLVHLWEEHGEAMVERLIGMFAFVIWDERRRCMFLARDRLGIKPLYWLDDGRQFACASEIKALMGHLRRVEIDEVALAQYLTFVAVPAPRTLIAGVQKLAPATTMLVDESGPAAPRRYWDPIAARATLSAEHQDWESELRTRLERSITRRMMSDVPVGVFLSGGVDSSTNVALMNRLSREPINTFSIGYTDNKHLNEFSWAREVAERFSTSHHETMISADDLWEFMPQLVHHQDEPIADPVCVPLYFLAKLAKENGVTVVHVGEGADELFAGYPSYVQAHRIAERYWRPFQRLPRPLRRATTALGSAMLAVRPDLQIHREALRRGGEFDGRLWWGGAIAFYEAGLAQLAPRLGNRFDGERARDIIAKIAVEADTAGARDELDRMIYQDLRLRLPELLLMRVDKLTMANAVEARVPFLDHELVELAMAMPASVKIRGDVGKHVLKAAVTDLLPADLVWQPKRGFMTPVAEWFRGPLGERFEEQIDRSALNELGIIDRGAVRELLALHRSRRAERSFQLWTILNLSVWFDHWIARRDPITV